MTDLSKAFDCIPHAKLHACGFDENSLKFIYSHLKERNQSVDINTVFSTWTKLLSGVPQ